MEDDDGNDDDAEQGIGMNTRDNGPAKQTYEELISAAREQRPETSRFAISSMMQEAYQEREQQRGKDGSRSPTRSLSPASKEPQTSMSSDKKLKLKRKVSKKKKKRRTAGEEEEEEEENGRKEGVEMQDISTYTNQSQQQQEASSETKSSSPTNPASLLKMELQAELQTHLPPTSTHHESGSDRGGHSILSGEGKGVSKDEEEDAEEPDTPGLSSSLSSSSKDTGSQPDSKPTKKLLKKKKKKKKKKKSSSGDGDDS